MITYKLHKRNVLWKSREMGYKTQKELAEAMGISYFALNKALNGHRFSNIRLSQLCGFLKCCPCFALEESYG